MDISNFIMKFILTIFVLIILADRTVHPISKNNSVLFPLTTYTESNERNIVMPHTKTLHCKIEGCNKRVHSHGYCDKHNARLRRHGSTDLLRLENNGRGKLPEYRIWAHIKERCLKPKTKEYENYGGRGIKVCGRWLNNFDNFLEDMGSRPTPKHQIDRIDNDGNYEPDNCRWVIQLHNARNKRTTLTEYQVRDIRKHIFMGLMNMDIEPIVGVHRSIISNIRRGYSYKNYGLLTTDDSVVLTGGYK